MKEVCESENAILIVNKNIFVYYYLFISFWLENDLVNLITLMNIAFEMKFYETKQV